MTSSRPVSNSCGYSISRDTPIPNTFRVRARARVFARLHVTRALPDLLSHEEIAASSPHLILGEGSNVLFRGDFGGAVLHLDTRGIELLGEKEGVGRVRVQAGENWDSIVRWSLAQGFAGLENLILIPGTVGAAPIQNIGAYGVEIAEFISAVEAWDLHHGSFVQLRSADCGFGYRDSIFRRTPMRYMVTAIVLALRRSRPLCLDYRGVRRELALMGVRDPCPADVGRAVERLRLRKLPDPRAIGSAGSFFKNPVVHPDRARELGRRYPGIPTFPAAAGLGVKLSAAWLIEACGLKGYREGDAAVSESHALVLVNYGGAGGADIWALAERIRKEVEDRFSVTLEPEPLIL